MKKNDKWVKLVNEGFEGCKNEQTLLRRDECVDKFEDRWKFIWLKRCTLTVIPTHTCCICKHRFTTTKYPSRAAGSLRYGPARLDIYRVLQILTGLDGWRQPKPKLCVLEPVITAAKLCRLGTALWLRSATYKAPHFRLWVFVANNSRIRLVTLHHMESHHMTCQHVLSSMICPATQRGWWERTVTLERQRF